MTSLPVTPGEFIAKCADLDARVHRNWFFYANIVTLMVVAVAIWLIWTFSSPELWSMTILIIGALLILSLVLGYYLYFNSQRRAC